MQRVLSIQTSRGFGVGETEYVSKRFCCSFVFSIGFLAVLGGFLLGRFSTYREFEIKKSILELERNVLREQHISYLNALNLFSDSVTNLSKIVVNKQTNNSNNHLTTEMWDILSCSHLKDIHLSRENSLNFKTALDLYLKSIVEQLTGCIQKGYQYFISKIQ